MSGLTPGRLWTLVFALWGLFLSGAFAGFVGSPGVIQAIRLRSLLETKQAQITQTEQRLGRLESEATALEHSRVTQEREIRRVLGYTTPDEIVFDFTREDAI